MTDPQIERPAEQPAAERSAAEEDAAAADQAADLLVEEVSIDGMCGVY